VNIIGRQQFSSSDADQEQQQQQREAAWAQKYSASSVHGEGLRWQCWQLVLMIVLAAGHVEGQLWKDMLTPNAMAVPVCGASGSCPALLFHAPAQLTVAMD
jgi:hypothetical protein